jgi:meso-butanediol dehydrogenase / (S,S)-butanediol dehydrogenase / diacetyl reductase
MKLKDRIAFITGGARGLGFAAAKVLFDEGASVVCADLLSPDAEQVKAAFGGSDKVIFRKLDVTSSSQVKENADFIKSRFGRLDILVNNAAINSIGSIEESTEEDFQKTMNINVFGTFLVTKYMIPIMKSTGKGSIINIASNIGVMGMAGRIAYTTSKGAIINFTRSMALDYASFDIRVNAVAPGAMNTEMVREYFEVANDPEYKKQVNAMHALNRFAEPEEIAKAILFLASDDSSYATGSVLVIDGGYTCGK